MNKIVGDRDFLQKLEGGSKHVEVFDADGKLLGRYLPEEIYVQLLNDIERAKPFDEEVCRQGLEDYRAGRGKSTEQILEGFAKIRAGRGQ